MISPGTNIAFVSDGLVSPKPRPSQVEVPDEVRDAAQVVSNYFKSQGIRDWKFQDLQPRCELQTLFGNIKFQADPNLPPGIVELRDDLGNVLQRLIVK